MELLWAPWRMEYITGAKTPGCIFCIPEELTRDRERLILHTSRYSILMMNKYPYSNGHLMIAPRRHTTELSSLSPDEHSDIFKTVVLGQELLKTCFKPEGFNIGINLGKAAGAGVDDHLHVHIVPRWVGDTNYMTALGEVRVIPDHILATFDILCSKLDEII